MDSSCKAVNVIRSYKDFMPSCKLQKEEQHDGYQIFLHGFKSKEFCVFVNDKKGLIKIEGQRALDGSTWSRFRQEFKVDCDVYNTKDINAKFVNGVLSIILPKREASDGTAFDPFVTKSLGLWLKIKRRTILRIATAVVVGVVVGGYVTSKYYLLSTHIVDN